MRLLNTFNSPFRKDLEAKLASHPTNPLIRKATHKGKLDRSEKDGLFFSLYSKLHFAGWDEHMFLPSPNTFCVGVYESNFCESQDFGTIVPPPPLQLSRCIFPAS